jgi:hypothetical protein
VAVSSHAYGQSTAEPAAGPADRDSGRAESERETLFGGGAPTFGGFGGPEVKGTSMLGTGSVLVGGHGGMVLNHVLVVGGAGYSLATFIDVPQSLQTLGASAPQSRLRRSKRGVGNRASLARARRLCDTDRRRGGELGGQ